MHAKLSIFPLQLSERDPFGLRRDRLAYSSALIRPDLPARM